MRIRAGASILAHAATVIASVAAAASPTVSAGPPEPTASGGARFVVRSYESVPAASPKLRSATVIRVHHRGRAADCAVEVAFGSKVRRCVLRETLGPGQRRGFCSRSIDHPLVGCSVSCAGGAPPESAGDAHVSSACDDVDVSAQVVYTRGDLDREWEGVSDLKVTPVARQTSPPER